MKANSFGFIGGGRVTRFLLQALKDKNALPEKVLVSDPSEAMRKQVQAIDSKIIHCFSNNLDTLNVDILFLSVHPPIVKDVVAEINDKINARTIIISLIPVFSIAKLAAMLTGVTRFVRIIPNAPSIIHQGYNPVVYGAGITAEEKRNLQQIFAHLGEAPEVDEPKLEAFAIVTAMGPTYFWPQWVKLQQLGSKFGMSDAELTSGMVAMLKGSVDLMYCSGLTPEAVMDLIPIYPLKDDEKPIQDIFETKLTGLFNKLTGVTK